MHLTHSDRRTIKVNTFNCHKKPQRQRTTLPSLISSSLIAESVSRLLNCRRNEGRKFTWRIFLMGRRNTKKLRNKISEADEWSRMPWFNFAFPSYDSFSTSAPISNTNTTTAALLSPTDSTCKWTFQCLLQTLTTITQSSLSHLPIQGGIIPDRGWIFVYAWSRPYSWANDAPRRGQTNRLHWSFTRVEEIIIIIIYNAITRTQASLYLFKSWIECGQCGYLDDHIKIKRLNDAAELISPVAVYHNSSGCTQPITEARPAWSACSPWPGQT